MYNSSEYGYDPSVSKKVMQESVNSTKTKNFSDGTWGGRNIHYQKETLMAL